MKSNPSDVILTRRKSLISSQNSGGCLLCLQTDDVFFVETLIPAFTLFNQSNACYTELQNTLYLPSKRMLRDISSNLSVNAGAQCEMYLEKKTTLLKQHEKLVNLQLDEIHIKPKI